ncbi:hypothetical protein SHJG_p266 (plasmid) [Streptomyces hygroscopicus subsp. jinggangensis 5008]|nr:hypothetical protein SHJG_p266 [Streptomyces hygroscopicus subsp. jinggangensis 5008]AGF68535.1 hypothetical protein SHJGH_p266 [Streptomyces hygroscopicus subsp. jinggangensis TL01]
MAALRDWSKPGRRADLLAAAWQAGETNVSALAEAARVSRPTVYADLRSRGIDPDHRPKGNNVITLSPLNIEGFTGVGDRLDAEYDAALRRWAADHPAAAHEEAKAEGMRLVALMDTTYRYADVRDLLAHEQVARAERDRLLHQVELRWEALSTATAWLAAHHAYVLAVDEARIAIDMWRERAEAALKRKFFCMSERDEAAYRQIQEAGHPALEPAIADLDRTPAQTAEQLRANLDQAHQRRMELASQTLRLAGAGGSR